MGNPKHNNSNIIILNDYNLFKGVKILNHFERNEEEHWENRLHLRVKIYDQ